MVHGRSRATVITGHGQRVRWVWEEAFERERFSVGRGWDAESKKESLHRPAVVESGVRVCADTGLVGGGERGFAWAWSHEVSGERAFVWAQSGSESEGEELHTDLPRSVPRAISRYLEGCICPPSLSLPTHAIMNDLLQTQEFLPLSSSPRASGGNKPHSALWLNQRLWFISLKPRTNLSFTW